MFEKLGLGLRALVYLRRVTRALEILAANDTERLQRERPPQRRNAPKRISIDELDLTEVQRRWDARQEALRTGMEYDE